MSFDFSPLLIRTAEQAEKDCKGIFERIDKTVRANRARVLEAFIDCRVSEADFNASTGYGYNDRGREKLDEVFARCIMSEDSLIRHSFASGTHTLTVALFSMLRPGDTMLCITGTPYDTIRPVIGIGGKNRLGSLADFDIHYEEIPLAEDGRIDIDAVRNALAKKKYAVVYMQRSRGYTLRPSLGTDEIEEAARIVHENSDAAVFADNCYGEFVEPVEPTAVGVDLMAGSLIKNPGGGIAKCGGYIAGKRELVEQAAFRMTAPGVGREIGATLGNTRELFMGLYAAPFVVGEAEKTAVFAARLAELLGFEASPAYDEPRYDIIQAIKLKTPDNLIRFCKGLQAGSPVDSYVSPEPWPMPGYENDVIMAAGTFTNGSSIELSCDAPLRDPFAVWLQGGLDFQSGYFGAMSAFSKLIENKCPD